MTITILMTQNKDDSSKRVSKFFKLFLFKINIIQIIKICIITFYFHKFCRTRTPTGTIQRSGSNLGNRTSNSTTTTAYGADGSRVTTTRTSSSYQSSSQAGQQSERNWQKKQLININNIGRYIHTNLNQSSSISYKNAVL